MLQMKLQSMQKNASIYEKSLWLKRGAIQVTQDGRQKGLWRSAHGHFVLPMSLMHTAITNAHNIDHSSGGQVLRHLQAVWWSPFMAASIDKTLSQKDEIHFGCGRQIQPMDRGCANST